MCLGSATVWPDTWFRIDRRCICCMCVLGALMWGTPCLGPLLLTGGLSVVNRLVVGHQCLLNRLCIMFVAVRHKRVPYAATTDSSVFVRVSTRIRFGLQVYRIRLSILLVSCLLYTHWLCVLLC